MHPFQPVTGGMEPPNSSGSITPTTINSHRAAVPFLSLRKPSAPKEMASDLPPRSRSVLWNAKNDSAMHWHKGDIGPIRRRTSRSLDNMHVHISDVFVQ